ncbi:putative leucine-rich repeat domain superfamily [Helianthus annuus]|nr:putative leucine-rich repeat domain superfamily [Helianthus annuus]
MEDIELKGCVKLISLPCNLPSIRKMKFEYCDGLLSLPDEIKSFKDLNKLEIRRCKHLSKRCKRNTGEDWHKISHIPDLSIQPPFPWGVSRHDDDDDSDDEEEEEIDQ